MEYQYSDRVKNLTGNAIREIFKVLQDPEMISFAGGLPTSQMLPKEQIASYTAEIMASDASTAILQYGGTEGYLPLRKKLTEYVKHVGIENATVDNTLVISGGQQAIDLAFKCFTNEGDNILVQNPTYLAALHIAKTYAITPIGVQNGADGIDLVDLENKIKETKPKLLYLVPTFHNPTGLTMTLENRKAVAELTAKYNLITIEDDPYRDLRYAGEALPAIKSFDVCGNIIYATSFSKVVSPGLRVGAVIASEEIVSKFTVAKQAVDVHTSNLTQAIVCKFLENGDIDRINEYAKPIYKEKLEAMISALEKYMPEDFKFTKPEGGLFIWCTIPKRIGKTSKDLFRPALDIKVAYVCGGDFCANPSDGDYNFRLNFSNATLEQIDTGIKNLASLIK